MRRRLLDSIKAYGWLPPLILIAVVIIGGLSYIAGTAATRSGRRSLTAALPTPAAPLPTLDAPFPQVDPALLAYLQSNALFNQAQISSFDLPPVGIYLPRTGNVQFELIDPTPLPTPLPFPTSPPLPPPTDPPPEATLAPLPTAMLLPTQQASCAPAGLPVSAVLTQYFHAFHSGIDLGIPTGSPVFATHSGQVTFADWSLVGYGYLVIIQNGRFITYYAHLSAFNVSVGDQVRKGSIIAWSGNTGNSSGPHVHYETRIDDLPGDPLTFENNGFVSC